MNSAGFALERILSERVGPVSLDRSVRFRHELKCRQQVTIKSQVKESRVKWPRLTGQRAMGAGFRRGVERLLKVLMK